MFIYYFFPMERRFSSLLEEMFGIMDGIYNSQKSLQNYGEK
jgi:hypothetical protein